MNKPEYIIVHTAAFNGRNCDAKMIDMWHKARGWRGIGYHYVILDNKHDTLPDGTLQIGRNETDIGAHCSGLNSKSLGICVCGNGDKEDFSNLQYKTLFAVITVLLKKYPHISLNDVLGHHEKNDLIATGKLNGKYFCYKTCPGLMINMDNIRINLARNYIGS